LEWEDEGIKEHASELLAKIAEVVPESLEKEEDGDEEGGEGEDGEEWVSDSEEDEEMKDS